MAKPIGKTLYYHQADEGDMNKTKKAMKQVEKRSWKKEAEDDMLYHNEDEQYIIDKYITNLNEGSKNG